MQSEEQEKPLNPLHSICKDKGKEYYDYINYDIKWRYFKLKRK